MKGGSMIGVNRRRVMGGGGAPLPYDAEIEYLKSDRKQYIELPYPFDNTDFVELEAGLTSMVPDDFLVTSKKWNNKDYNRFSLAGIGDYAGNYGFYYGDRGTGNIFVPNTAGDHNAHLWRYQNYICQIVDLGLTMDVSEIPFAGTTTNLVLFWSYKGANPGVIYSFKHKKATGEILDLIPVRVGQVGYMYDKVSKKLFGNNGTGSFILGPDKN